MPDVQHITISGEQSGQRLDNWLLARLKGVPKSHVYRLLRTGQVRVNGKRAKPVYRVDAGDQVRIPPVRRGNKGEPAKPDATLRARLHEAIIYESEHLLVLDKPAGLAVHGGSGIATGLIESLSALRPRENLGLAHRLDRFTSGCLVIARDRKTLLALNDLMRAGQVTKEYLVLVAGQWARGEREVTGKLETRRLSGERVTVVSPTGRPALTRFTIIDRYANATLMRAELGTGRTHQIRVHAAYVGHPVAGDKKYGEREFNRKLKGVGLKRMFLHANRIAFELPGGESVDAAAPLPEDLRAVLNNLQGN